VISVNVDYCDIPTEFNSNKPLYVVAFCSPGCELKKYKNLKLFNCTTEPINDACSRICDEWIILVQCSSFSIAKHLKMAI
jgi:hypothetical protein